MKRTLFAISAVALSLAIAAPGAVRAQEQDSTDAPAPTSSGVSSLGDRVRSNFEERFNNIRSNREYRNSIAQERSRGEGSDDSASTTSDDGNGPDAQGSGADDAASSSSDADVSSTTPIVANDDSASTTSDGHASRHGHGRKSAPEGFAQGLSIAFDNLTQIRDRLSTGIDAAAANGADVSAAQNDLSAADAQLAIAKTALQTFASASTTPETASSTAALGRTARSALKDARDALASAIQAFIDAIKQ